MAAFRNTDDHALASAGHEDTISVLHVHLSFRLVDVLPMVASKAVSSPTASGKAKVRVPCDTHPVKLEALNVELGGYIFQVIRRANVAAIAKNQ